MNNEKSTGIANSDKHSIGRSVFLHLIPGVIVTLLYVALIPLVRIMGYPSILALFLAVIVGVIPFQFGYVLYHAKKRNGSYSLKGVFEYSHTSPWWQYLLVSIGYVLWSVVCFIILPKLYSQNLMETFFYWVPDWFIPDEGSNLGTMALTVIIVAGFVSNLSGAIVEELYFRGILLPKISWMGTWAPRFSAFLFTIYHFDSIWQSPERFINLVPIIFLAWYKKDLKMIIFPHCALNFVSIVLFSLEVI
jgi:hypothetical protein